MTLVLGILGASAELRSTPDPISACSPTAADSVMRRDVDSLKLTSSVSTGIETWPATAEGLRIAGNPAGVADDVQAPASDPSADTFFIGDIAGPSDGAATDGVASIG